MACALARLWHSLSTAHSTPLPLMRPSAARTAPLAWQGSSVRGVQHDARWRRELMRPSVERQRFGDWRAKVRTHSLTGSKPTKPLATETSSPLAFEYFAFFHSREERITKAHFSDSQRVFFMRSASSSCLQGKANSWLCFPLLLPLTIRAARFRFRAGSCLKARRMMVLRKRTESQFEF